MMFKRMAKIATVAAAALVAVTVGSGSAHAGSSWGPIKFGNGLCLDVPGSHFTDGAQLQFWGCNGTQAQQWWIWQEDSTHFEIQAAWSDDPQKRVMCVNNWEGGDTTGNHMALYPCSAGSANDTYFNWVFKGNGLQVQPKVASINCINSWGGLVQGAQARLYPCADVQEEDVLSLPL
ncbi:RICIN domain-containing protein [Streptacidiphilus anmyonensis]|uniref:RICIN domain-containing protein n=1 Tax=Streptacidiphilus anmyonensis TaxID=405782 RepID=UPI0005AA569E|nr:ricin-type beta-trefoil lectin domain protein [Streptacidiphilus anmyonensis]